ncbi:hypothetical protein [Desulfatitalea tepidiphila]|uniref:hypothetical protein n=1 Tax=Desulfatitalea tepidiphila TaxID=1185843 RepID=UPI0013791F02|nr:hypothetical protein [Desulfatitalea tepidiphila]
MGEKPHPAHSHTDKMQKMQIARSNGGRKSGECMHASKEGEDDEADIRIESG